MRHLMLSVWLCLAAAAPSFADVTIKQTMNGAGMGMNGSSAVTTYIKGMKMRSETVLGDSTRVTIFDVEQQKMYSFDTKKKEADVWDMQTFGAEISKSVDPTDMKTSLKPNGNTKQIAGKAATGYDMEVSMPATIGGPGGMKMMVTLAGPMWVVKNAPGTQEFMNFYKGAVEKGWIFSDPRAAKGAPGQAKAMAEMYRQLAEAGGLPYETEMHIKIGGDGPMAAMMAKMGAISTTTTVQSVDTGALSADLFAPPAGYKLNARK